MTAWKMLNHMNPRVLLITGGTAHPYPSHAQALTDAMAAVTAEVVHTQDVSSLESISGNQADCVVLFVDGERLSPAGVDGLTGFVRGGGGLVALHSTAAQKNSHALALLVGSRVKRGVLGTEYSVTVSDNDHPVSRGIGDFHIKDEIYELEPMNDYRIFLSSLLDGTSQPIGYSRTEGAGRVVYLANGHEPGAIANESWRKVFARSVQFVAGQLGSR